MHVEIVVLECLAQLLSHISAASLLLEQDDSPSVRRVKFHFMLLF